MSTTFKYLGHTFEPAGKVKEAFNKRTLKKLTEKMQSLSPAITNQDGGKWDHKEFYTRAAQANAEKTDLFTMNGSVTVIPAQDELFEYKS